MENSLMASPVLSRANLPCLDISTSSDIASAPVKPILRKWVEYSCRISGISPRICAETRCIPDTMRSSASSLSFARPFFIMMPAIWMLSAASLPNAVCISSARRVIRFNSASPTSPIVPRVLRTADTASVIRSISSLTPDALTSLITRVYFAPVSLLSPWRAAINAPLFSACTSGAIN